MKSLLRKAEKDMQHALGIIDKVWKFDLSTRTPRMIVAIGLIELAQRMLASEAENHEANAPGRKDPK